MRGQQHIGGFRRRFAPACFAAILMLHLAACRTTTPIAAIEPVAGDNAQGWVCLAFRPIAWSSHDTPRTASQIREHNAVWDALCTPG